MTDPGDLSSLDAYQRAAQRTDQIPVGATHHGDPRLVPLLGIVGEVGTLLAGYKKHLRDGDAYELFDDNVEEELGDVLWYLANAAEKWNLSLSTLAARNLAKTADRWRDTGRPRRRRPNEHLDASFIRGQRLPRTFEVAIVPGDDSSGPEAKIEVWWKGHRRADSLGDNTYDDSGYRFHDAFHLANAAVLGWSPVARAKIFDCKRKADGVVDTVEDGGRAIVIEEGIAAYLFAYARRHNFLAGVESIDFDVLKTVRLLTGDLEVSRRPLWEIEDAILQGFAVWRELRTRGSGRIIGDLGKRSVALERLTKADRSRLRLPQQNRV